MPHTRFAAWLVLAFAVPASAQQLPTPAPKEKPTDRVYEVPADGLVIDGKLSKDDPPLAGADGAPHRVHLVRLKKGERYVLYLTSRDFDALLVVRDTADKDLAFDHNSGGDTDARVALVAPADGDYRLIAAAFDGKPGGFLLKVRSGDLTAEEKLADRAIALNREGIQLNQRGQAIAALTKYREALEIRRRLYPASKYPDGHPDLASSFNNLGFALKALGQSHLALPYYRQSLEMRQKLYPKEKYPDGHPDLANSLNNLGAVLQALGHSDQALPCYRQSLEMQQQLYPKEKYPTGHPDLANSLNNLGAVLQALGHSDQALPCYRQSLEMYQKLYPTEKFPIGQPQLAQCLNNLGAVLQELGQAEQALPYYRQGLEMRQKLFPKEKYPDGHPQLAQSVNNMGFVLEALGRSDLALPYYRQGLGMRQRLFPASRYPDGHPDLALSINNMGGVLDALGQDEQALPYYRQGLEMHQKLYPADRYPSGHPQLALSLDNLGVVLSTLGQLDQALPYVRQGLEMRQKLFPAEKFPDGHPDLATSLNNLAFVLQALGRPELALPYYRQVLEMYQKLFPVAKYPDGHPDLATNLNNLGSVLGVLGQADQALRYHRQSLEMRQKLYPKDKYPDGHPDLAASLNNLGSVLTELGHSDQALPYSRRSLEMYQKLYPGEMYPEGHPQLAASLNNLGFVLDTAGLSDQALPCYRQSLEMQQRLLRRELTTASEEAAFDKLESQSPYLDAYLNIARTTRTPADEVVARLWPSQAIVTRLLEQRQANTRAAGTALGDKLDRLRDLRRRLDQLVHDAKRKVEERDRLLTAVARERDALEREVIARMPTLKRWEKLDVLGPADLRRVLPQDAVFLDVIRYTHIERVDPKLKLTPSYVAFVLTKDRPTQRVELGEAASIDRKVRQWRGTIDRYGNDMSAASQLKQLVWDKLAPHLPRGTKTLYLSADGDLARLPWAALPVGDNRVLLEDYAVALVPHGTFLLEQLKYPKSYGGDDAVLALGGVRYGSSKWPELPGTSTELAALDERQPITLSGTDATPARLLTELPKARVAHLATHGFFNAEELTKERERAAKALESRLLGDDTRRVAAKNPLGYVGLVLAKGEVLSGLSIPDVPLTNTRLVTLSACETGLGALTGGEGVQGLQRAFHLAGCPNVVASLWKVNDDATAALMTRFYHELFVNKKPPIEALREAQLLIYHRPDLKNDLLAERGSTRKKQAVAVDPRAAGTKHAPTKLWAAFVLSGVGR